uniref:Disease resistance N-terminal domain-containing protein n=1 Tax=Triticum aestivum TaxID=4565 RepID=A0A3B6HX45_WHEAT
MVGVGAGTGALGSVIGKLTTLLGDEYTMLKRVRKDIEFLERELRWMQILVNSLANMEELDELAKNWKSSMRDLSYDMEECVDRFMLRLGNGDARPGFAKRTHYRKLALPRRPNQCRRLPSAYFALCRQPRLGRRRILAVGLPRAKPTAPVGIHMSSAQLRTWRQQLSAYPGRRHTRGPGDPARDQRLTSSNLCRRPGRAAVAIYRHATSPIRGAPSTS